MGPDEVIGKLSRTHPSIFSRFELLTPCERAEIVKYMFRGKDKIRESDINLMNSLMKRTEPFNLMYRYAEYMELMLENRERYLPIYLDIYNHSGLIRKEYIEAKESEKYVKGDRDIEICCMVIPISYNMEKSTIFPKLEELLYDSKVFKSEEGITYYWNSLLDLFEPHLEEEPVDIEFRQVVLVEESIEKDFRMTVGRYNLLNRGRILYIGSNIFIESFKEGQLYINKYKIDLNSKEYKQELIYFIEEFQDLFKPDNLVDSKDYETEKLNMITEYLIGG